MFRVAPYSSEKLFEIDDDDVVSPESETEEEDIRPVAVESIKPKRILVVDDEQFMLQFLQGVLEEEGFLINTAANGVKGLRMAQREIPDLIITDYNMPEMDGVELNRKLRNKLSTSYIPTMILTGVDEVDSEIESLNSGADDYELKPVNARKLIARVNRLLKRQIRVG